MADHDSDIARLEESLRRCRCELAGLREEQETWAERLAPLELAERRLRELALAIDEHLTAVESDRAGLKGWVKRRLGHSVVAASEVDDLTRIRESPLFDAAWYFSQYPDAVVEGLSAALHYLRIGAPQRRAPGPHFDAARYANQEELRRRVNPLLHYHDNVLGASR